MRFIFNIIFGLLAINSVLAAFTNAQAAPTNGEQHTPKVYLQAGAGGGVVGGGEFSNVGVMGTRLSAGYWLTSDLAIEGAFAAEANPFGGVSSSGFSIGANWLAYDHLSLRGAIRQRLMSEDGGIAGAIGEKVVGGTLAAVLCGDNAQACNDSIGSIEQSVNDLGLEVALASEWRWGAFTLGIEWASLYQPLYIIDQELSASANNQKATTDPGYGISDIGITARFLTLSLGATF